MDTTTLIELTDVAASAIVEAAEHITQHPPTAQSIDAQLPHDVKLAQDKQAETIILNHLTPTEIPILAEETCDAFSGEVTDGDVYWVVDPLDGTMNFLQGLPIYCSSIALWQGNAPLLGLIYDIPNQFLYRSDEMPERPPVPEAAPKILCTGFPSGANYSEASIAAFIKQVQTFSKVRMFGSAAMALTFVAKQAAHHYYEQNIKIWDVAAALALVSASGGRFEMQPGDKRFQYHVKAWANGV